MAATISRPELEASLGRELAAGSFVLVVGPRGSGKTALLKRVAELWTGPGRPISIQVEPIACSPEVLATELRRTAGPTFPEPTSSPASAFDAVIRSLRERRDDSPLLLDDVTELRSLSYYPGVERPLERFLDALRARGRALATSRFGYWTRRSFPELPIREVPPLGREELSQAGVASAAEIAAASGGLPVHAARLAETIAILDHLEDALVAELSPGGRIEAECRATLAELLHRARGYGACKTALRVLAEEEGLKLSEVARRMHRTAGSTRDYLRWLEEVDLIRARDKRFDFVDPLLRRWLRIYGRGAVPREDDVRKEVARHLDAIALEPTTADTKTEVLPPRPVEDLVEID